MNKKYKIGIFGSYNNCSIGDNAILQGMLNQFRNIAEEITIFTFDPDNILNEIDIPDDIEVSIVPASPYVKRNINNKIEQHFTKNNKYKYFLKISKKIYNFLRITKYREIIKNINIYIYYRWWREQNDSIKNLDILLIGGGNIIMDMYKTWPVYPYIYSKMANKNNVPSMLYSVGAGPINTKYGEIIFKKVFDNVNIITTRDDKSSELIKTLCKEEKIFTSADPAFNISNKNNREASDLIGLTIVPYFDGRYWPNNDNNIYHKYIVKMANLVDKVVVNNKKVVFFSTNYPNDNLVGKDIYKYVNNKNRFSIIEGKKSINGVLDIISKCSVVIGTRLHSLILSFISKKPIIAISYQPKVRKFCEKYWDKNFIYDLNKDLDFSINGISNDIDHILRNYDILINKYEDKISKARQESHLSKNMMIHILKKNDS